MGLVSAEIRTERQARELAESEGLISKAGPGTPEHNVLLSEFLENVYLPYCERETKPSTYASYEGIARLYLKPRIKNLWLCRVTTREMQALIDVIAKEHGLAHASLQHIRHFLSGLFSHAMMLGYIDPTGNQRVGKRKDGYNGPMMHVRIPKGAAKPVETGHYSLEEVLAMLTVLDALETPDAAMATALAGFGGFRKSELQGLRWEDYIEPGADSLGLLSVRQAIWHGIPGTPKTPTSMAAVPLIPQLSARLDSFRRAKGSPISGPILDNGRGKARDLDALFRRQMVDPLKRAKLAWRGWHSFRRGLATSLNRLGIDDSVIQRILRHADVETTQKAYIKVEDDQTTAAMRTLSEKIPEFRSRLVLEIDSKAATERVQ